MPDRYFRPYNYTSISLLKKSNVCSVSSSIQQQVAAPGLYSAYYNNPHTVYNSCFYNQIQFLFQRWDISLLISISHFFIYYYSFYVRRYFLCISILGCKCSVIWDLCFRLILPSFFLFTFGINKKEKPSTFHCRGFCCFWPYYHFPYTVYKNRKTYLIFHFPGNMHSFTLVFLSFIRIYNHFRL